MYEMPLICVEACGWHLLITSGVALVRNLVFYGIIKLKHVGMQLFEQLKMAKLVGEAKTIDLCNNPMTKEPKLSRARRLLPEWSPLNEEANSASKGASELSASASEGTTERAEL